MSAPELKPCPFCGERPVAILDDYINGRVIDDPDYIIRCENKKCHVGPETCGKFTEAHIIREAWNTRADLHDAQFALGFAAGKEAAAIHYENGFPSWDVFAHAAKEIRAIPAPSPLFAALALPEVRMQLFLYVLREAGGRADCSDDPGEWVAAFCDDRGRDTDTFNRAADEGLITVWHNDISESSRCEITDKGRAAIAAIKEAPDG